MTSNIQEFCAMKKFNIELNSVKIVISNLSYPPVLCFLIGKYKTDSTLGLF